MKGGLLLCAGALLVLVPMISANAGDNTGTEPYSFSYQAESAGGFSSHQESGDGSGKVQGFYIIMGEDGRDRRVDYVADENGYRASISTNEVGTRSESSADAQFNTRLPSQGQLEQAKVSAEEYRYLEDQHAAERERHSTNFNRRQQQSNATPERQQWAASGSNQIQQSSQVDGSRSSWSTNQQQQQQQPALVQPSNDQANSTAAGEDLDEGWRRSAKLSANQSPNQSAQQKLWQQSADQQTRNSASSAPSRTNQAGDGSQRAQLALGSFASATTAGPIATLLNAAPAQRQRAQQAAWQLADRGAAPARLPAASGNSNYLQRQLEQQFMQQAYQLTDQDYPRQQAQLSKPSTLDYSGQFVGPQQQQQLQQQQTPLPVNKQRPWQVTTNNDLVISTGANYGQVSQQQSNIIDEVAGEQVEAQVGTSDQGSKNVTDDLSASISVQAGQEQPNFSQPQQPLRPQFVQPTTTTAAPAPTTTTGRPTPSGFFSINLSQENSTASVGNQLAEQEVDTKQPKQQQQQQQQQHQQNSATKTQTSSFSAYKTTEQTQGADDYQQVTVQQQQQQKETLVPNPIKQVVENTNQQVGGSYVESNQAKQQAVLQNFVPSSTLDSRLDTTTQAPETPTTQQQQKVQAQVIEASQAPQRFIDASTTTTSQRPTAFQQFVTSTGPSRVPYDASTVATTSSGSSFGSFTQRPTIVQTQRVDGVKGRFVGSQLNSTLINRFNEPASVQRTVVLPRPTGEGAQVSASLSSTAVEGDRLQSSVTSGRPGVINGNRFVAEQVNKQSDYVQQQLPIQRPAPSFEYNPQRQQTQAVTGGEIGTTIAVTTNTPARVESIAQQQQQRQQSKAGTKGGSSAGKRQFWLQQQQPLIPSSQRALPPITTRAQAQQPSNVSPNGASVDYATGATSFGSRISGR